MNTVLFWKSRNPEDPRDHFTSHANGYWGLTDSEGNYCGFLFLFLWGFFKIFVINERDSVRRKKHQRGGGEK